MSETKKRKVHTPEFKAKVALEGSMPFCVEVAPRAYL